MTDVNIEVLKLQHATEIRRAELQAEVKKVVYGTFLLGVAVALFPVISGWIEHRFNLRIEETKQVNQLALQQNQLNLDLQKLVQEVEAAKTKASFESTQSDRKFFEDIADEARSANLSDRITIAEFFTALATTREERDQWKLFRDRLLELQNEFNTDRAELMQIIADPAKTTSEVQEAVAQLRQIGERESGVGVVARLPWVQEIPVAAIDTTGGKPLTHASKEFMQSALGIPHASPSEVCQPTDNPALAGLLSAGSAGPVSTLLLAPANLSLARVFDRVKAENPDLYDQIGSAGSLCVRLMRGSGSEFTNHSWGTAIDLTIAGQLDTFGDGKVQIALAELSKYFADEGWIWGAGFANEDAMHFEVSQEKLQEWLDTGLLAPAVTGK